jgi:hypothetical protein
MHEPVSTGKPYFYFIGEGSNSGNRGWLLKNTLERWDKETDTAKVRVKTSIDLSEVNSNLIFWGRVKFWERVRVLKLFVCYVSNNMKYSFGKGGT